MRSISLDWNERDEAPTVDPKVSRAALTKTVHEMTPVDLLWLRTTVEDELLRRGYKPAPLHKG